MVQIVVQKCIAKNTRNENKIKDASKLKTRFVDSGLETRGAPFCLFEFESVWGVV
jgi:hypothetical protein